MSAMGHRGGLTPARNFARPARLVRFVPGAVVKDRATSPNEISYINADPGSPRRRI